jgi:alkylation response protein AidB-like acyl-CoA dehydrogenase
MGMRGTGSHDFAVEGVFVPVRRTAEVAPIKTLPASCSSPIYRLSLWFPVAALAAPALGAAQAAIDALIELGRKKRPNYTIATVAERPVAQLQLASAQALVGAGRAYLHEAVQEAWAAASQGQFLDQAQKIKVQLAACHAVRSAAEAVDLVHAAAGTSAIRLEQPFERCFRDVHVITQHAFSSAARLESAGKLMFGQPTDWPFFAM